VETTKIPNNWWMNKENMDNYSVKRKMKLCHLQKNGQNWRSSC
jgi:hypothetical protein